jgi:hypothetical protein
MRYLHTVQVYPWVDSQAKQIHVATAYSTAVTVTVFPHQILWRALRVWILRWQCMCCHRRIPKAFPKLENSISGCICMCSLDSAWNWLSSQMSLCSLKGKWYLTFIYECSWDGSENSTAAQPSIACHSGVSHMQMWWTLHEENVHPYLVWKAEHLGPRDLVQLNEFVQLDNSTPSTKSCFIHRWSILYLGWYK